MSEYARKVTAEKLSVMDAAMKRRAAACPTPPEDAVEAAATRIYNECRLANPKFAMPYNMCEELARAALSTQPDSALVEAADALDKALGAMLTFYGMDYDESHDTQRVTHRIAEKAREQFAALKGQAS